MACNSRRIPCARFDLKSYYVNIVFVFYEMQCISGTVVLQMSFLLMLCIIFQVMLTLYLKNMKKSEQPDY